MLERERITTIRDQMMMTTTMLYKKMSKRRRRLLSKIRDLISYLVRSNSIRVARKTPARHRSLHSL